MLLIFVKKTNGMSSRFEKKFSRMLEVKTEFPIVQKSGSKIGAKIVPSASEIKNAKIFMRVNKKIATNKNHSKLFLGIKPSKKPSVIACAKSVGLLYLFRKLNIFLGKELFIIVL